MAKKSVNLLKSKGFWGATGTAALVAGVCIGAVAGHRALSNTAGEFRSTQGRMVVRFNWPVHASTPPNPDGTRRSWLPLKVQQDLTDLAVAHLSPNLTDGQSLAATSAALMQTGWFESIEAVRRADANTVDVIGRWRTPVAVVRVNGPAGSVDRLVSARGELLPIDYPAGSTAMRAIIGVTRPAPEQPGSAWDGTEVQSALSLMAYVCTNGPSLYTQVAGVDVSQYAAAKRLALVTDSGAQVVWGEAPEKWAPSEPSPDQKLQWLAYLRNGPEFSRRIDAGRRMVDVTSPRGIMVDQSEVFGSPGVADPSPDEPAARGRAGTAQPQPRTADRRRADRR